MKNQNNKKASRQHNSTVYLSKNLEENLQLLREALGPSDDVIIRDMMISSNSKVDAAVIYIDGLVDRNLVNQDILKPLMFNLQLIKDNVSQNYSSLIDFIKSSVLTVGQIIATEDIDRVISDVLIGHTAILVEGVTQAMLIDAKGWKVRNIEEAKNELAIRGPRVGFNETLRTNTALLRRIIRDPRLTFESLQIGERSKTDIAIVYIKGIIKDSLIDEIKQRLKRINTDAILDIGYIEQYIEDNPLSVFSTIGNSERPDVTAARVLEGRAAILVDGSPFALTLPMLFIEGFQSPEDYYARLYYASFIRWIRFLAFVLSVYLPAIYVALMSFHQELLPSPLLITVSAAKEGIPFPVGIEAIFMIILFEILREAGLRMPRTLGQAVSIVGALVIGQASVSAGLVGAPMVVVLAATAIASFVAPSQADLGALLRIIVVIFASFLGLFGIIILSLEILSHLASLRSLGVPYLSPIAPLDIRGLKDTLIRAPLWAMDSRPASLDPRDTTRQSPGQMPQTPKTRPSKREGQ
jgi:Bacillus/Clostridium GerA spore germination protein.